MKVHGDQALAQQCYTIVLRGTGPSEAYPVDGLDTQDELSEERGEPVEDLETIPLNNGNKEHTVQIGSKLDQVTKKTSHLLFAGKCKHIRLDSN